MKNQRIQDNIGKRPKALEDITHYKFFPEKPLSIDFEALPDLLRLNLMALEGIKPITTCVNHLAPEGFSCNPNQQEIDFYREHNAIFQIVHVVANVYDIQDCGDRLLAKPYAINLIPAVKRGKPETVTIDFLEKFDLEKELMSDMVYANLNPFSGEAFFGGPYSIVVGDNKQNWHTDAVGFILGTYFLKNNFEMENAMVPFLVGEKDVQEKYTKYLKKRLYKWYSNTLPRKLWGADSPIELFLAHAFSKEKLYPVFQTVLLDDGRMYPSFFHMFGTGEKVGEAKIITEIDFYFPDQKLAVFCDSIQHHRGNKNQNKDLAIDKKLYDLGIKSIRINSRQIFGDIYAEVDRLKSEILISS